MKPAKQTAPKKTPGTLQAEEIRARCNKLTDAERAALRDEAMRLYYDYGCEPQSARAHRR